MCSWMNTEMQTLEEAADYVLNVIRECMGASIVFVARNDGVSSSVLKIFHRSEVLLTEGSVPYEDAFCRLVLQENGSGPLVIENTAVDERTRHTSVSQQLGACSFVGIPIQTNEHKNYGTICAIDSKPYTFTEKDVRLLEAMASFLSYFVKIENAILTDDLTNTYNRNYLAKYFSSWEKEQNESLGLLFIDIDDFKIINDTYGHEIGDLVLKEVAKRLRGLVRRTDAVTRLGGDEFILLIPNDYDKRDIESIAKEIMIIMQEPCSIKDVQVHVSISVGLSYFSKGMDLNALIRRADTAMYMVKKSGKGKYLLAN